MCIRDSDSTGIVDEPVLDKLKLNVRSLIASQEEDSKDLLDLCICLLYTSNVNYIAGELFTECLINSMFIPGTDKDKADELMSEVLKMQDELDVYKRQCICSPYIALIQNGMHMPISAS